MCPDPQLLSVYMDGELPSPWKEKMETHLSECPVCSGKINSFRQLFPQKSDAEQEMMEAAKDRVFQKLQSQRSFPLSSEKLSAQSGQNAMSFTGARRGFIHRRLSIPLPAAAAAALLIILMTALLFRSGQSTNDGYAYQQANTAERTHFILAAEEEIPSLPFTNLESILQHLPSDGSDIIILRMPERTGNFSVTGEPAIIRAADFQGRQPGHHPRRHQ